MIGIAPGRVLSGVTRRDLAACGAACRDLGLDGRVHVTASPQWGKRVTWRYSDARSPEGVGLRDRKSTRLNSSHGYISYAVFCLKKKKKTHKRARAATHAQHTPRRCGEAAS